MNNLIDQTFTKVNRLFVSSFGNENNRISFSKYYEPNAQIEDLSIGKVFFDMPIKNDEETYE